LAEVKSQEDEFNKKSSELKAKTEDESLGVVNRNKAKNELSQHLASDPLPLRKAKISQEAAVKKQEKATQASAEARSKAEEASKQATQARHHAEESARQAVEARHHAEAVAKQASEARHSAELATKHASEAKVAAEAAVDEMAKKLEEAEAYFDKIKSKPGSARGALWWMDREIHEAKAYLPTKKGGRSK